jgi:hypothetical protein
LREADVLRPSRLAPPEAGTWQWVGSVVTSV